MSRKHFRAIANAVYNSALSDDDKEIIARELSCKLSAFNANFDRDKFINACVGGM